MPQNTTHPLVDAGALRQRLLSRIFSGDLMKNLDQQVVAATRDTSSAVALVVDALRSLTGQTTPTSTVIDAIPAGGLVINQPGTYVFGGNLSWSPAAGAGATITIRCNQVTLDMRGYTLTAAVPDLKQYCAGIFVTDSSDVTLVNGTLADMCFYGVCASSTANLTIENVKVTGLRFNNLNTRDLCPAGIHIDSSLNPQISGCTIQGLNVISDSSAGIQLVAVIGGAVSNCAVGGLVNNDGSVQGYSYIFATGVKTTDCSATALQSFYNGNNQTPGHTVLGFLPMLSSILSFDRCTADGMTGCCDDCHGMSVFLASNVVVKHFTARNVVDGPSPYDTGAKATGLEVYGSMVAILDCTVENIHGIVSQDKQSTGFSAWGTGLVFNSCTATNVSVTDPAGNPNPAELGYGTGFGWAPDPRAWFCSTPAKDVIYTNCTAVNCQAGFDTWFHVDSLWYNPVTTNCGVDILQQPGAQRTLTANACSEVPAGISTTLTNIASGNIIL